jgi:hypothetical protein
MLAEIGQFADGERARQRLDIADQRLLELDVVGPDVEQGTHGYRVRRSESQGEPETIAAIASANRTPVIRIQGDG